MRRRTRSIHLGRLAIGSDHPVSIQSMTDTHTADVAATVEQTLALVARGADAVRVAVPRMEDAKAIAGIKEAIGDVPLVADIHFDHNLALAALDAKADGIRINPGNMRNMDAVAEVVRMAVARDACIRIGVNSGSIRPREGATPTGDEDIAELMVSRTLEYLEFVESLGAHNVKLSLKASDVPMTIRAYRAVAGRCDVPLHLGVTSAGPPKQSIVRSSIGIGTLLAEGVGDTIRVSMTGSPLTEVAAGLDILEALHLRKSTRPRIVSCPTCGRCEIDLARVVEEVEERMPADAPPVTVAIMGCVVNGPGEASEADVGIAGGKGFAFLFRHGEKIRRLEPHEMVDSLLDEIKKMGKS